jgi:hypothetical protein
MGFLQGGYRLISIKVIGFIANNIDINNRERIFCESQKNKITKIAYLNS